MALAGGVLYSAAPTTVWVVVLAFVFLECAFIVGLFLPGDSLLFNPRGPHFSRRFRPNSIISAPLTLLICWRVRQLGDK